MAINAYCGLMGSGKSYEAVSSLIVPAIAVGRRVVSNIDGLNQELIHDYIIAHKGKFAKKNSLTRESLGSIELVNNEQISQPHFFPDPEHADGTNSVVKPGDFVVIDEAWRFWPTNSKPSHEHMQFFKMHRHYAHPGTGVTSDLALIIQDISGLHLDLRKVVEMSVRTTKLKSLGLNSRYRVEVFEGYRQTRTAKTATYQKAYDKRIFPLYKSYGSDDAKETTMDGRQNIFRGAKVWVVLAAIPVFLGGGIWYLLGFFGSGPSKSGGPALSVEVVESQPGAKTAPSGSPEKTSKTDLSSEWRIVGLTMIDERPWVVLQNSSGRLRYEHSSNFENRGPLMRGVVDGDRVTTYSGSSSGSLLGSK